MALSLTKGDVEKLIVGATILGTGGGGDPKEGKEMLETSTQAGDSCSPILTRCVLNL